MAEKLLGDLVAGVPAADDEDGALLHVAGSQVAGAVRLEHVRSQVAGERRQVRRLERAGRDDGLIRLDAAAGDVEHEPPVLHGQRAHEAVELDREVEGRGVLLEVGDDVVAARIGVGIARERQAGKPGVPPRREEDERVPARAPGGPDRAGCLEDLEAAALAGEEVAQRQPGLAGADHGDVQALAARVMGALHRAWSTPSVVVCTEPGARPARPCDPQWPRRGDQGNRDPQHRNQTINAPGRPGCIRGGWHRSARCSSG